MSLFLVRGFSRPLHGVVLPLQFTAERGGGPGDVVLGRHSLEGHGDAAAPKGVQKGGELGFGQLVHQQHFRGYDPGYGGFLTGADDGAPGLRRRQFHRGDPKSGPDAAELRDGGL